MRHHIFRARSPRNPGQFDGLTGPTYKLAGQVHALPPPRALRVRLASVFKFSLESLSKKRLPLFSIFQIILCLVSTNFVNQIYGCLCILYWICDIPCDL